MKISILFGCSVCLGLCVFVMFVFCGFSCLNCLVC